MARPASVSDDGLECTVAPQVSIIDLRYGFCSNEAATCQTSQLSPNRPQAKARALPHWPAPVSVVRFFTPSWAL
ncbi:hypothetical protein BMS3Bbin02_01073 [bacterium BMS3Bbin02]|nr:hypothetical protein BMS3Bbin02_01073 [bacterium BMS3Bbin02]